MDLTHTLQALANAISYSPQLGRKTLLLTAPHTHVIKHGETASAQVEISLLLTSVHSAHPHATTGEKYSSVSPDANPTISICLQTHRLVQ